MDVRILEPRREQCTVQFHTTRVGADEALSLDLRNDRGDATTLDGDGHAAERLAESREDRTTGEQDIDRHVAPQNSIVVGV